LCAVSIFCMHCALELLESWLPCGPFGKGQRERVSWSSDKDGSGRASSAPTVVQLSSGENSSFPIREKEEEIENEEIERKE
jgi:hypothetical protein